MVLQLEKIAEAHKTNEAIKAEAEQYLKTEDKPTYLGSSIFARSVEYDCDCGDGCDSSDGCDTSSCDND